MAIQIFAIGGVIIGKAIVDIANTPYPDHSDYSDYHYSDYSNHSDYSDAAVRRERRRNELNKSIDSERNSALNYIEQTVKPYTKGTSYSNCTSETIFDMDYNSLDSEAINKINSDCTSSIDSEKSSIEEEIRNIDAMLDLLNKIESETK